MCRLGIRFWINAPNHEPTAFCQESRYDVFGSASQTQLAEKLGVSQQMVGYLELSPVAIRPELLAQLSEVLAVPVEQLLGMESKTPRMPGPIGKARQVFERVSQLPRATQQRILANVEDALTAHEVRKAG